VQPDQLVGRGRLELRRTSPEFGPAVFGLFQRGRLLCEVEHDPIAWRCGTVLDGRSHWTAARRMLLRGWTDVLVDEQGHALAQLVNRSRLEFAGRRYTLAGGGGLVEQVRDRRGVLLRIEYPTGSRRGVDLHSLHVERPVDPAFLAVALAFILLR
jgi:hypothetical protein